MLATKLAACSYILVRAGDDSKSELRLKRGKLSQFVPYRIGANCFALIVLLTSCAHRPDRYAQSPVFGSCINGLRMIDGSKQQWAFEKHLSASAVPTLEDLRPYLRGRNETDLNWLHCPSGGVYTIGPVGEPPKCSYGGPGHVLP